MTALAPPPRTAAPVPPHATAPVAPVRATGNRALWHAGATAIIWLTSLFVVALWVAGGGIPATLGLTAETLTTLGRLTGLVSANLLLYQVLLMARVPVFERGFGRDAITRMHRFVGFWSFWLLVAHIGLLVAGYAASSGIDPIAQLWEFIWEYPGMLLATAGTLLILLVVVTSIRRARRKLRYESWHLLHLYAYLGVGLALPHQLWTGADFLSSPLATAYWWTLWAIAAASVLVFRIALPLARSARHGIRVTGVERDGDRGVTVRMSGRALHRLKARAGQFFVWRFVDGAGWTRGHPFSLSGTPHNGTLSITARFAGDGTHRLAAMPVGTRVLIEGPYGHMTGDVRSGSKLLMIGAGAGVAPLVALLEEQPYAPGDAVLLTRDSSAGDALRQPAIEQLVALRGVRHAPMAGPRAHGGSPWLAQSHAAWRGPDLIRFLAPDLDAYDVYVCGPADWMRSVQRDLRDAGVPADRIHSESFTI